MVNNMRTQWQSRIKAACSEASEVILASSKRIPFVGILFQSPWEAHKNSGLEVILTVIFSLIPLLITALYMTFFSGSQSDGYVESFAIASSSGQLFLYCTATLAPVCIAVFLNDYPIPRTDRAIYLLFVLAIAGISLVFYVMKQAEIGLDDPTILSTSRWAFVVSILIFYLTNLYGKTPEYVSYAEQQREQADDYSRKLARSRR